MPSWKIITDGDSGYRWEIVDKVYERNGPSDESCCRLPSMDDLLQEGCREVLKGGNTSATAGNGNDLMFRTCSGKAVSFSQSSIAKAMSILDHEGGEVPGIGMVREPSFGFTNSLFQTGSGKSLNISPAGLVKAKTLFGMHEDNNDVSMQAFQGSSKSLDEFQSPLVECRKDRYEFDQRSSSLLTSSAMSNGSSGKTISRNDSGTSPIHHNVCYTEGDLSSIKFQTAGGKSLSVSRDALRRAKSLLGDPDVEAFLSDENICDTNNARFGTMGCTASFNDCEENFPAFTHPVVMKRKFPSKTFVSPLKSTSFQVKSKVTSFGENLFEKFNEVEGSSAAGGNSSATRRPLGDISNTVNARMDYMQTIGDKKRVVRNGFVSGFKKPRSSKFSTPFSKNIVSNPNGSDVSSESFLTRTVFSNRYPFKFPRLYLKKYLADSHECTIRHFDYIRSCIMPEIAHIMLSHDDGSNSFESDAFVNMLIKSGVSSKFASKEWVRNHCKWIVWKLACYDTRFPVRFPSKLLTVSNVLEELKYRYEREFNYGHRSAIKRILGGDAPSTSMLILCIAAVYNSTDKNGKLELTDGWYAIEAILDAQLSMHLASGKLFVGQKLCIWGAGLQGWVGPVSPLEALSTVSLVLHINGTYKAHWADKLGFRKDGGIPLAFRCIKTEGGPVPRTLVGVTRIYPVLYREKLLNGGAIVRCQRMEVKMVELHDQRRSALVEGVISDFQRRITGSQVEVDGECEGAKIFQALEKAAEPEILMAEMSSDQLASFASYQSKMEARKQRDMQRVVDKALAEAALGDREVTPFMRVKVAGLTSYQGEGVSKEGLITIWNPTEKQQHELVEGQAYVVEGLAPVSSNLTTLYLQARGSTVKWQPLSSQSVKNFKPFYSPRMSTSIVNLGEVSLCSEFDVAAFVLHVGDVFTVAQQKKQWVFVTDNSNSLANSVDTSNSLLAIRFSCQSLEEGLAPVNQNLAGSIVGFCNLIKRSRDHVNQFWIADALENSTLNLSFGSSKCSHLQDAASALQSWAKNSSNIINHLKLKVVSTIGHHKFFESS